MHIQNTSILDGDANLDVRWHTFHDATTDFVQCWRAVLKSVTEFGIGGIPRDQLLNALRAKRLLKARIRRDWDAFEFLQEETDEDDGSWTVKALDEEDQPKIRPLVIRPQDFDWPRGLL